MQDSLAYGKLPWVLTFPFKGERWFGKLAIAALLVLATGIVPIIPTIFLAGYICEIIRRIIVNKEDATMPEWNDWGKYLSDGLKLIGAALVVIIPVFMIVAVLMTLYIIPLIMLSTGYEDVAGVVIAIVMMMQIMLLMIVFLFATVASIFQPVYITHMLVEGPFKAIFQVKAWWVIFKAAFWQYIIGFMVFFGISALMTYIFILVIYSVIFCCFSPFVISAGYAYLMVVYGALMAYAYRDGLQKLGLEARLPQPVSQSPAATKEL